jgi:hypothetical protein
VRLRRRTDQCKPFLLATIILRISKFASIDWSRPQGFVRLGLSLLISSLPYKYCRVENLNTPNKAKDMRRELGNSGEEVLESLQAPTKER